LIHPNLFLFGHHRASDTETGSVGTSATTTSPADSSFSTANATV